MTKIRTTLRSKVHACNAYICKLRQEDKTFEDISSYTVGKRRRNKVDKASQGFTGL